MPKDWDLNKPQCQEAFGHEGFIQLQVNGVRAEDSDKQISAKR